ncbi:MAG: Multiple RNA-binding domain-containing protein 1 [Sclerophora amabilis]|nr:MAG: Multiple RNA-binding domain-containing protein 1 [Sclerophora amabilis]
MEVSRIFVRGLPPNLSEAEFNNFFSSHGDITDAKLLPHRRIGYVGYKSPEDAAHAVKYFNRTFFRMSKIAVELARPFAAVESQSTFRKIPTEHVSRQTMKGSLDVDSVQTYGVPTQSLKRKRGSSVEAPPIDTKLGEFLEVMRPSSKSRPWQNEATPKHRDDAEGEGELNERVVMADMAENGHTPRKISRKIPKGNNGFVPQGLSVETSHSDSARPAEYEDELVDPPGPEGPSQPHEDNAPDVQVSSDSAWLRMRTSRLLGLVDDEEDSNLQDAIDQAEEVVSEQDLIMTDSAVEAKPQRHEDLDGEAFAHQESEPIDVNVAQIQESGRLFLRNLSYSATEKDLWQHFSSFGNLNEVHVPVSSTGSNKGFAYLLFTDPDVSVSVYKSENGKAFQGRLLHILPAGNKKENKMDDAALSKLPLKKQKQIKKKAEAATSTFNWNSLYLNSDAVMSSVADRLGVPKSALLDPTSSDAAVKQAHAETHVIQETKQYFATNGVDLNAFKRRERGENTILVKNFPYGTKEEDLNALFEQYGDVKRLLMPPNGIIAIVEFAQDVQSRSAFANLAYRRFKDSVLFLEKAPKDLFSAIKIDAVVYGSSQNGQGPKLSGSDLLQSDAGHEVADSTTLFVRNLSFATTTDRLSQEFKPLDGFLSARVKTKHDPKNPGQTLSMGFGFLEFRTKSQAQAALSAMNGQNIDGHRLLIRASHKGLDAGEERKKEDRAKKSAQKKTKIIIKNLPFEVSKKDVRSLFGSYGQLRSIRVPKKFNNSARGFAFADFVTVREAENAMNSLKDTHLLGRRLILEFAAEDPLDAEQEIENMQKKIGGQVNKVALQRLTGSGRRKFNIEEEDKKA